MVKKRVFLSILALLLISAAVCTSSAYAQNRVYHFNYEYAKVWINQNGTIDLFYNISLTVDSGRQISEIDVGQPQRDFTIGDCIDQYGRSLQASDASSGNNYLVTVRLAEPLTAGNTIWFTLTTNVAGMLSADSTNPSNIGMQFAPEWRTDVSIPDIRVQIVFPQNVTSSDVKTSRDWNNNATEPDGRLALYWEKQNLQPNEVYIIGVSFPASALPGVTVPTTGPNFTPIPTGPIIFTPPPPSVNTGFPIEVVILGIFGIIAAVVVIAAISNRKSVYQPPKVSMESLGIRRGLTAVEASYLLGLKPPQIVTEILYSLLQKRAVWAENAKPVKLRIMSEFQNKKGPDDNPLRYYEIDFLNAIKPDGMLDEKKLANAVMSVRDTLEQKLIGYSRQETVGYYRKIVDKAWSQVDQAGTVDVASKAYDEQLLWLMLDPNYRTRTETTFRDRTFEPNPLWFWYWYGYIHYHPYPTNQPNVNIPSQPTNQTSGSPQLSINSPNPPSNPPKSIPGADFANNIATSVENTANNIVTNLEGFAKAIVPPPPPPHKASQQPANRGADCVCACHACACACACVSCACACAGGGVRIK